MEKHWKSVVKKQVCDYFLEAQRKAGSQEDIPPVIQTPHHYLVNIFRNDLYFLAVITSEVSPLFVIEFLHRVVDIFTDYFHGCSESILKEYYVIVYELLDEVLDNGFPLAMEVNVLKELIRPPNFLRTIADTITGNPTGVGAVLPTGQLSSVPWRRAGVKYANNEAYFDVTEEVDVIIDKAGTTVSAEIQGYIDSQVKLSGMPDLTLSFENSRLLDDVSFHPCVRFGKWETDKVVSFVPPDGHFRLISYHVGTNNMIPVPLYVKHNILYREGGGGLFDITVQPKQTMGKSVEKVVVECPFPKVVLNVNLYTTTGKHRFDPVSKVMRWDIGTLDSAHPPNLKGSIQVQTGASLPESNPILSLRFVINSLAISGLKVRRLDLYGEKYKPFKGVKYLTKAGKFQVRT